MNDRAIGLLEQYDVEVLRTRKGRGAILCDTKSGCLIFKEYAGNDNRILMQDKVLKQIRQENIIQAELIVPTKEASLVVKDTDGVQYILKTYLESRECNIYDRAECADVVKLLARLHEAMEFPPETEGLPEAFSPASEYNKRNKELKRVRKFLQQRSQKTWSRRLQLQRNGIIMKTAIICPIIFIVMAIISIITFCEMEKGGS